MRVAVYARVSSEAQRERHTIASQLSTVPDFCARQGWTVVATYTDDGRTAKAGRLDERQGFTRLLADAAKHKFEAVAVVDLDRLTRSEDLAERGQILGTFQRLGVRLAVASTGQVLDLSTSSGDLFATLAAFFAAEENRKRRDRTKRGRERAAKEGRPPTRAPWGLAYERRDGWRLTDDARTVRDAYDRLLGGASLASICHAFNSDGIASPRGRTWRRGNLSPLYHQTAYHGEWRTDGAVILVPAIVTLDEWHAAQARLAENRTALARPRQQHPDLIAGLAVCACGARMRVHSQRPGYRYYECSERWRREDGSPGCRTKAHRVEPTDALVWTALAAWLDSADLQRVLSSADEGDDAAIWQRDLVDARQRIERLDAAESGLLTRVRRQLVSDRAADLELERIVAERRLAERQAATAHAALGSRATRQEALQRAAERVEALRLALPAAGPEERRELVRLLLPTRDSIRFDRDGGIVVRAWTPDGAVGTEIRLAA